MADVERERVTALWREAAAAVETPRCTCTEDESSDGSATYEDDPHCPIHGWCSWRAENKRLREQLDALREAFQTYVDATTFKSSLPDDVGSPNAPTRNAWAVARAALGVEGEQENP